MPSNHRSCCSSGRIERSEIGDRKGALYREFFRHVTEPDLRLRLFAAVKEFSHSFIVRLTQIDYARTMAFLALDEGSGQMLGAVHAEAETVRHIFRRYIELKSVRQLKEDLDGAGIVSKVRGECRGAANRGGRRCGIIPCSDLA